MPPPRAEPEPDAMGRSAPDSIATYDACQRPSRTPHLPCNRQMSL